LIIRNRSQKVFEKTLPQIKNPDDLQLTADHPGFCIFMTIAFNDGNGQKSLSANLTEILAH